jgi:hypothetical protein
MGPSLSWLDPSALAEGLLRAGLIEPQAGRRPAPSDLSWRGVGGHKQPEPTAASLLTEPARPAAERVSAPFNPPPGTLQTKLKAYLMWLLDETGCRSSFVVDREGLVLIERGGDPVLIALSSAFLSLLERVNSCLDSPSRGALALELDSGESLQLMKVDTQFGTYVLGVVVPEPLRHPTTHALRQALTRAMDEVDEP